jgi:hypothetical protein
MRLMIAQRFSPIRLTRTLLVATAVTAALAVPATTAPGALADSSRHHECDNRCHGDDHHGFFFDQLFCFFRHDCRDNGDSDHHDHQHHDHGHHGHDDD